MAHDGSAMLRPLPKPTPSVSVPSLAVADFVRKSVDLSQQHGTVMGYQELEVGWMWRRCARWRRVLTWPYVRACVRACVPGVGRQGGARRG